MPFSHLTTLNLSDSLQVQRITRYPLLIRQVLHYTQNDSDRALIEDALKSVERVLNHINEAIREQEGRARLEAVSKNLYVGQGCVFLGLITLNRIVKKADYCTQAPGSSKEHGVHGPAQASQGRHALQT